ncbi:MAG: putative protein S-acyltransferase 23 [Rickettsiaceae bacterium]|jgi:hypothetical protein|nr:putative protein S-acyltransferase 23 [Rickettsiaceae bacterium]
MRGKGKKIFKVSNIPNDIKILSAANLPNKVAQKIGINDAKTFKLLLNSLDTINLLNNLGYNPTLLKPSINNSILDKFLAAIKNNDTQAFDELITNQDNVNFLLRADIFFENIKLDSYRNRCYEIKPLSVSAYKGSINLINYICKQCPETIDYPNRDGSKPIHWAIRGGNVEAIELLLAQEAEIDATDKIGSSPLHWAARRGDIKITKFLIEKGASQELSNFKGETYSDLLHIYLNQKHKLIKQDVSTDFKLRLKILDIIIFLKDKDLIEDKDLHKYIDAIGEETIKESFINEKISNSEVGEGIIPNLNNLVKNYELIVGLYKSGIISYNTTNLTKEIIDSKAFKLAEETLYLPKNLWLAEMFGLCKARKNDVITGRMEPYLSDENRKSLLFKNDFNDMMVKIIDDHFPRYKQTLNEIATKIDQIDQLSFEIEILGIMQVNYEG